MPARCLYVGGRSRGSAVPARLYVGAVSGFSGARPLFVCGGRSRGSAVPARLYVGAVSGFSGARPLFVWRTDLGQRAGRVVSICGFALREASKMLLRAASGTAESMICIFRAFFFGKNLQNVFFALSLHHNRTRWIHLRVRIHASHA